MTTNETAKQLQRSIRRGLFSAALFMSACAQTSAQTPQPPECPYIGSYADLANCRRLADEGSTAAMRTLAEGYARGFQFWSGRYQWIPPDQRESLRYYTLAADLGDEKSLRHVFEEYHFGRNVPKNQARAEQYLKMAAEFGSEWAILLLAQGQEKLAPRKALEAYLRLARNDNCAAQIRLAQAYASGVLVKKNLTQAYFWLLLAKVNKYHAGTCGMEAASSLVPLEFQIEAKEMLPAKLMQTAQDAATNWTKGESEKLLPAPAIPASQAVPPDAKSREPPKVAAVTPRQARGTSPQSPENQNLLSRVKVPLKKNGGIFVVPVEINGAITLEFAIDSGASDVSVPADVFLTLQRAGTIKDTDIIGEQTYVLADGSKSQSVTFTIRSLKIGDKVVENVRGSVASVRGTLLLGQTFLGRFKSWSLDNNKHELFLESQ